MSIRKGNSIIACSGAGTIASTESVGLVKPDGSTIQINEEGTISAIIPEVEIDTSLLATKEDIANMATKDDIPEVITSYNDLTDKPTIPSAYTLPTASTTTLGGVKVDGSTITIANGIISSIAQSGSNEWSVTHNTPANNESYVITHIASGFKIQCGTYKGYPGQTSYTHTLPSNYSTFCWVHNKVTHSTVSSRDYEGSAVSTTTSSFTTQTIAANDNITLNWIAIGY